mmetsp:Transcript_153716/g.268868  ORF Transcript_153716/g.268868 Transcript_153716/m.268868 type:complete len:255 (-) Transcript_153716:1946-2710(-)
MGREGQDRFGDAGVASDVQSGVRPACPAIHVPHHGAAGAAWAGRVVRHRPDVHGLRDHNCLPAGTGEGDSRVLRAAPAARGAPGHGGLVRALSVAILDQDREHVPVGLQQGGWDGELGVGLVCSPQELDQGGEVHGLYWLDEPSEACAWRVGGVRGIQYEGLAVADLHGGVEHCLRGSGPRGQWCERGEEGGGAGRVGGPRGRGRGGGGAGDSGSCSGRHGPRASGSARRGEGSGGGGGHRMGGGNRAGVCVRG